MKWDLEIMLSSVPAAVKDGDTLIYCIRTNLAYLTGYRPMN